MKNALVKNFIQGIAILFYCARSSAQIITTVAGGVTGHGSYWGDGGPATAAAIGYTAGIVVDSHGNLYIADGNNQRLRKVDAFSGIITTIAGTGIAGYNGDGILATAAQLNLPGWVAVDTFNNIYVVDAGNYRIRKINAISGIINTVVGNGIAGFSGDGFPAIAAKINGVQGIAIDAHGNLYLNDGANYRVRKVDATGTINTIAGTGVPTNTGDGGSAIAATISGMLGICTDAFGNIYTTDSSASIRKINAVTGVITRVAGTGNDTSSPYLGDGLLAISSHISPFSAGVDNAGNLYIADYENSRIEKVDSSGVIHTIAGTGVSGFSGDFGLATSAEISLPENVIVDKCSNIYISDFNNRRIRKVTYPPTPITLTNAITTLIPAICAGTPATFAAASTTSSGAITYQWYVNGSPIAGATTSSYTYTPADADSIGCIATATNPCISAVTSSNTIIMSVIPIATPAITVTAPAAAPVGATVTVNATVAGAGTGYTLHWYNNAVLFSTTAAPATTYTKPPGTDHITATVVPGEGCYDSTISTEWLVTTSTTGLWSNTSSPLERPGEVVYPNPVGDVLHIIISASGAFSIQNIVGQVLQHGILQQGSNTISVKDLPAGVYVLEIVDTIGNRSINKIIKQ